MKNGDKLAFITFMFILGASIGSRNSRKKLDRKELDPSIGQYLNRLIEFYPTYQLDYIEDEFLTLVDFGFSPSEAFKTVVKW
jgi:hypothetical protein